MHTSCKLTRDAIRSTVCRQSQTWRNVYNNGNILLPFPFSELIKTENDFCPQNIIINRLWQMSVTAIVRSMLQYLTLISALPEDFCLNEVEILSQHFNFKKCTDSGYTKSSWSLRQWCNGKLTSVLYCQGLTNFTVRETNWRGSKTGHRIWGNKKSIQNFGGKCFRTQWLVSWVILEGLTMRIETRFNTGVLY
jgi:hypothetical protein